jgi:hypothetical protein
MIKGWCEVGDRIEEKRFELLVQLEPGGDGLIFKCCYVHYFD